MNSKFDLILEDYYSSTSQTIYDHVMSFVLEKTSLSEVIVTAAKSEDKDEKGQLHRHQYRIGRKLLRVFSELLLLETVKIQEAQSFDEIYKIISNVECTGVRLLTRYDIALRIGIYLGKLPDKIYIQRGAKQGAEKLLGRKIKSRFIERSELMEPFKSAPIECWELEVILCRFKDRL